MRLFSATFIISMAHLQIATVLPAEHGGGSFKTLDRTQAISNAKIRAAFSTLEARRGEQLSGEQRSAFVDLVAQDQTGQYELANAGILSKAIYCVAYRLAAVTSVVQAECLNIQTMKGYSLHVVRLGLSFQASVAVFRLRVDYEAGPLYATDDPVPGSYFAMQSGLPVGPGVTKLVATSKTKSVVSYGLNFGLGLEQTFGALLNIE